jgi:hypothetical protein
LIDPVIARSSATNGADQKYLFVGSEIRHGSSNKISHLRESRMKGFWAGRPQAETLTSWPILGSRFTRFEQFVGQAQGTVSVGAAHVLTSVTSEQSDFAARMAKGNLVFADYC